jgi:hypothetical protein
MYRQAQARIVEVTTGLESDDALMLQSSVYPFLHVVLLASFDYSPPVLHT